MLNLIFVVILFLNPFEIKAQGVELDYFNATENKSEVLLKWAISKGETCNGILITRSTDSLNFEAIGQIEGVCGSPDFQQPYTFVDTSPLQNTKAYYRLELGISDFSVIISIEVISKNERGYQVRPQPMQNNGRIYFDNSEGKEWNLKVLNTNTQVFFETKTTGDFIELNTSGWPPGLFVFILSSGSKNIQGKLIIIR